RAHHLEANGQRESALQIIEVLVRLSPGNTSAMDRAAGLHYRAGRSGPAYDLLEQWHQTQPTEPMPLVRQALLFRHQTHSAACFAKLQHAMSLSPGRRRANIAFLGARLALQSFLLPDADQTVACPVLPAGLKGKGNTLTVVQDLLRDCLAHDAAHP